MKVQQRTVEQLADVVPMVQILDILVPQMVDQLVGVLARFDFPVPEQVIEVPKIVAQDLVVIPSFSHASISHGARGAADGGAVGGGADCRVFFLAPAADCRADY